MKARCDSCKFWKDNEEDWEAKEVGFRICTKIEARWNIADAASTAALEKSRAAFGTKAHEEKRIAYESAETDAIKRARAYVQDGSSYRADLCTAPDFGCVLFEAL